ncbi:heparan-sulfate 6-o-sulfotransferase 2-like [Plakobranchus ocellatus]|uniref:Heparan-sulfate 6-O-sulfotransferase n=1 Tax=Plakobranchus ocellatus TaxID=259542 RepID=A0AAV4DNJ6_9GAST|nr:heparan-sulfate 6-o-sulfotransferase 2-like [Plakobranchus ocellatus]
MPASDRHFSSWFRLWTYYRFGLARESSQLFMAVASSLVILLWISVYARVSSPVLFSPDHLAVKRALAADAKISAENFEFWRRKGLRMAELRFLKPDPDGILLDDVQAYRSNLLIQHALPKQDLQFAIHIGMGSDDSSGRAVGYQVRGQRFKYQSEPNQFFIAPLCPPSIKWVKPIKVNFNESDVLVMLHMQKTGGTSWDNHLVLNMDPGCDCHGMNERTRVECRCWNSRGQVWMINRNSVNWPCGLHASYTELTSCLDAWFSAQPNENRTRNYRYMTVLRDPVTRFFSEWMNVRGGRTWMESRLHCDGRDATIDEVPWCFQGSRWLEPTLDDGNMGINRMTRMLANLSLSDCYRQTSNKTKKERDEIMLASAKANLASFAAFGLTEYPKETQALIEKSVLGMTFKQPLSRDPDINYGTSYVIFSDIVWNKMVDANQLDVRLYQYAKDLFFQRLQAAGISRYVGEHEAMTVPDNYTYKLIKMV